MMPGRLVATAEYIKCIGFKKQLQAAKGKTILEKTKKYIIVK